MKRAGWQHCGALQVLLPEQLSPNESAMRINAIRAEVRTVPLAPGHYARVRTATWSLPKVQSVSPRKLVLQLAVPRPGQGTTGPSAGPMAEALEAQPGCKPLEGLGVLIPSIPPRGTTVRRQALNRVRERERERERERPGAGIATHRSGEQINNARYRAGSHQSATRWLCLGSGWQLGNSLCFRTGRPAGMCYNLLSPRCSPPFHPSPNKGPAMFAPCLTDHIPCRIGNSVPLDVAPAVRKRTIRSACGWRSSHNACSRVRTTLSASARYRWCRASLVSPPQGMTAEWAVAEGSGDRQAYTKPLFYARLV